MKIHKTPEYMLISHYYKDQKAERSGLPLINHIKEGIQLLIAWDRPEIEQRAFALHPIVQSGQTVTCYRRSAPSDKRPIDMDVIALAQEYTQKANLYLCRPDTDEMTLIGDSTYLMDHLGNMSPGCAWMLLADKVQNQKDFRIHHWFTHERAYQLEAYFNLWIKTLKTYYI